MSMAPYAIKGGMAIGKALGAAKTIRYVAQGTKRAYNIGKGLSQAAKKFKPKSKKNSSKRGYRSLQNNGNEGHTATFITSKKLKKPTEAEIALKNALPEVRRYVTQGYVACPEGSQQFSIIAQMWNMPDLVNQLANSTAIGSSATQSRTFIQGGSIKAVITNFTSTPVIISLYMFKAKNSQVTAPDVAITNSLGQKYNNANQALIPWMTPKEAAEYTVNFQTTDTKQFTLSPGETIIEDFYFDIEKYYDNSATFNAPQYQFQKGFTHGILMRQIGTPVTDSTKVSYAANKVGYISHYKFISKTPQGRQGAVLYAHNDASPQTGLAFENFIGEETGTKLNNVSC